MVYIREAHASDEWPLGDIVSIKQHKTLKERINAAKELTNDFGFNIRTVVDTMDNNFEKQFLAWPEQYYFFRGHEFLTHSVLENEFAYARELIRPYLFSLTGKQETPLPPEKLPVISEVPITRY